MCPEEKSRQISKLLSAQKSKKQMLKDIFNFTENKHSKSKDNSSSSEESSDEILKAKKTNIRKSKSTKKKVKPRAEVRSSAYETQRYRYSLC